MYGKKYLGPARAAYLFDDQGKLLGIISKVDAAKHGEQILEAIKVLK
jgi:peroxiredoxin